MLFPRPLGVERSAVAEKLVSVFLEQDLVKKEAEAKKMLRIAEKKQDFVGGRIFSSGRGRNKKFVVQRYFRDDGGAPPIGMARYRLPGEAAREEYGIKV